MATTDDVFFWLQVIQDSKRVILCSPEQEAQIQEWLTTHGQWLYEVRSTPIVPNDRVYVIDQQGIEAQLREWEQGGWRNAGR